MIDSEAPVRYAKVKALLRKGEIGEAVAVCKHTHVGALSGSCTEGDPRHGKRQKSFRCFECGAHVDGLRGNVINTR